MLQYLLNATAIWLISLVLFDVFLKKESYHVYNRFYLLLTFLLGALLPLVHWPQDAAPVMQAAVKLPVQQVLIAKEQVINAATPVSHAFDWDQVLGGIYVIGVLVAISLLLIDIVKLAAYYRGGPRTKDGKWLVIETGKEHAPFSFLNTLFVNSRAQYSDEEWEMILVHEQRHTALLHFADLLLMQAARVLFWFHPLIYVYNKRLLLVHEYQADKTAKQPAQVYGRFLVEQAILQSAPALSHSFNRSPIKNRIAMLTHRSSEIARSKLLLFIPLLIVCVFCFSQNSFSNKPKKEGNVCLYRGN